MKAGRQCRQCILEEGCMLFKTIGRGKGSRKVSLTSALNCLITGVPGVARAQVSFVSTRWCRGGGSQDPCTGNDGRFSVNMPIHSGIVAF